MSDAENVQTVGADAMVRRSQLLAGMVVFILGVGLMLFVFVQALELFRGVDGQVAGVTTTAPVATPSNPAPAGAETAVIATPTAGLSLSQVAVSFGLKLVGLLVLGWIAALVAAKGIQMSTAGKRG